ncbi:MAG: ATP-binding protein [Anaerolineae bacterium]
MGVQQLDACSEPGSPSAMDHRSSLLAEASVILARVQQVVDSLLPESGASQLEGLMRDLHSYKSVVAFAHLNEVTQCVTDIESALGHLWLGRARFDATSISRIRRAVSGLALMHSTSVCHGQADLSAIAAEIRAALGPADATVHSHHPLPLPSRPAPAQPRLMLAQVDAAQLAEIETMTATSIRLLRRLDESAAFQRDERTDMMRLALDRTLQRLGQLVHSCRCRPLQDLFAPFAGLVAEVAEQHGKLLRVTVDTAALDIELSLAQALRPAILHIFRNAVAHGIETPTERLAAGKPESGLISVSATQTDGCLRIAIHDDGRGFDTNALRRAAVTIGAVSPERGAMMGESESIGLALMPGISTASARTELCGSGMGLSSVAEDLASLGGDISIESEPGQGTTVVLDLPLPAA